MDTTYEAEGRLDMLKSRSKRCVCKFCGGALKLKSIMFSDFMEARIEIFCDHCNRIEYGVEPEIYQSAQYFVDELNFNCFPNLDENESTKRMNIAKVCEIMAWENKTIGILDDHGFKTTLDMDHNVIGEAIIFTDDDLDLEG